MHVITVMRLPTVKVGLLHFIRTSSEACKRFNTYMSQLIFVKIIVFGVYSFIHKVRGYEMAP
jgi:hypothetical protein